MFDIIGAKTLDLIKDAHKSAEDYDYPRYLGPPFPQGSSNAIMMKGIK